MLPIPASLSRSAIWGPMPSIVSSFAMRAQRFEWGFRSRKIYGQLAERPCLLGTAALVLLLSLGGCQPEASDPSPPPSSLLVLDVSVWNEGAVVQLPIAKAAEVSNHLGAVPPLAFAIEAGPYPVVGVVQTMFEDRDSGWGWHIELHRYDRRQGRGLTDTLVVGLSDSFSAVSFSASPGSSPVRLGAPAAAGPVVVVRQREGTWEAFGGPNAFSASGASPEFEAQVRERLTRTEPQRRPSHAATRPVGPHTENGRVVVVPTRSFLASHSVLTRHPRYADAVEHHVGLIGSDRHLG